MKGLTLHMSKQIFGQKWIILWKKWCKKVMEQECQDMVHDVISNRFRRGDGFQHHSVGT